MKFNKQKRSLNLPTIEQIEAERERIKYRSAYKKALFGTIYALVIVAAIAVLISSLVLPVLQISGNSMDPTLCNGDIIVLVKTKDYDPGDLCSFSWSNKTLIKRIIAKAGDWVSIDDDGTVYVNDKVFDEPYVSNKSLGECDIEFPYQVPEKSYFVMGDKRDVSVDSRSTVIGAVGEDQIVGKVWLRVYPFKNIGFIE